VEIPIENLFYLLCYAWDVLEPDDVAEVGTTNAPDLENLIASVLIHRLERLSKRGLERDYEEFHEDSGCIRGRIYFQDTVKRALHRRGMAHIVFDELSPDTLANRILKGTIGTLLQFATLSASNRDELAGMYRGMRDISDVQVTPSGFYRVRLHRNNNDYRVLLSLCEMVQQYVLPTENGHGMRFVRFNKNQMWKLFQLFVANFYRKKQNKYDVLSVKLSWYISQSPACETLFLPGLETDIVLSDQTSRIVIDTKFYSIPFDKRYDKLTVKPGDINQLFAYMQNLAVIEKQRRRIDGILLYATTTIPTAHDWTIFGHNLRVAGINLAQDWGRIQSGLLSLIGVEDPDDRLPKARYLGRSLRAPLAKTLHAENAS
jgi:5-methylcytosine-specific restriction enzyme subunit McrC